MAIIDNMTYRITLKNFISTQKRIDKLAKARQLRVHTNLSALFGEWEDAVVIHWMPIPKPPKGE